MRPEDLNELPPWEDDFNDDKDDGESWKTNPTRDACKAMYQQWNTVVTVLKAAFDSLKEPKTADDLLSQEMLEDHMGRLLGDAYEVAVKIRSSEAGGLYIIRMENAAIIRKNAQYIKISTNHFLINESMEAQHISIIRSEIDKFKDLFKAWVASFKKDDCDDEWGLFI